MNNFTFYSPTLFTFGDGEEKNTGALVRRFGGSRVLLVTGGGYVRRNGAYDAGTASLEAAGIPADLAASVHLPIGEDILAVTPAEIAVSIAAQLIRCRAELRR